MMGCRWLSLEWHCKVNIRVRYQVSVMSREIVCLDCEAKLWFKNWKRNYPFKCKFYSATGDMLCEGQKPCSFYTFSTVLAHSRYAMDIC